MHNKIELDKCKSSLKTEIESLGQCTRHINNLYTQKAFQPYFSKIFCKNARTKIKSWTMLVK